MGEVPMTAEAATWRGPALVVAGLLSILVLVCASCERNVADLADSEISTYLQAESLGYDFDLEIGDGDRLRSVAQFGEDVFEPPSTSAQGGGGQRFDHPRTYTLLLAPFVRMAGPRGAAIFNALMLALAAWVAMRRLGTSFGSQAALVIILFLFATVTYRAVFLIRPHVFLLTTVVCAMALALRFEEPGVHHLREIYRPPPAVVNITLTWLAIGLLAGVVATYHPLYLVLLLPLAMQIPTDHRKWGLMALLVGTTVLILLDPPDIQRFVGSRFDVGLSTWSLIYLAVGRNIGLLPYFLPVVIALGWIGGTKRRTSFWLSVLVAGVGFALLEPFDLFDGPAAVGNGWLLPLTGALWFVPSRPVPRQWIWIAAACSALTMLPTWAAPNIDLVTPAKTYRHSSGWLNQWLPVETTQRDLPAGGERMGRGLWVRSSSAAAEPTEDGGWQLEGNQRAELTIASPAQIGSLYLQFGPQAEPELEVRGGQLGNMVLAPDGGIGFQIEDLDRRALHPMWWSGEKHHVYVITIRMPQPGSPKTQMFTVRAFGPEFGASDP
ncbi:MAG: hypothetical protein P8Y44_02545 [Acidobacteriota bacterium]